MCGIAGMAGIAERETLDEMLDRIRHRGPDDSGTFLRTSSSFADCVGLGNRRLSIIDLSSAAHQPIANEDETVWVVYNGEIFNFQELRAELIRDGHRFKSHTDSEVLVHLYEKHGPKMVERLNGMFAFALWDDKLKKLFLYRDRMGVKPLYYAQRGNHLYFGSEIKSLFASPELAASINLESVYQYMALLYVPDPATMFEGIRKLSPGHMLVWHRGEIQISSFWEYSFGDYFTASEDELAAELKSKLIETTQSQMVSDVPVGFFLSGGLDSSTLVACAAASGNHDLKCFSIAFTDQHGRMEQNSDDAGYARMVAKHFKADFREIVVEPDVVNLLPKVIYHLDEPVADHAAIATYLICRAAKPEVTVLLSGQGGDEVFAGYRAHLTSRITSYLRWLPAGLRSQILSKLLPFATAHAAQVPVVPTGLLLAVCRYSERILRLADMDRYRQYAHARSYFSESNLDALFQPATLASVNRGFEQVILDHFRVASERSDDFINQMLYVDTKTFLPDLNLAYSDKLSMAASIEVRVPFLDNNIVDFMSRVPPHLKLNGFNQKYLLRKAMQGLLPQPVITRRKAGFGLPVRSWLRNELKEMVRDLLSEETVRSRGIFDPAMVQNLIAQNEGGKQDYTLQIWALLTLELWQQTYLDSAARQVAPLAYSH